MSNEYDITVIGNNLQAAMLVSGISNAGVKVLLLSNANILSHSDNERFILFEQQFYCNFFEHLKQKQGIEYLKSNAAHLLISTQIEQYKTMSLFSRGVIGFNNIISSQKINLQKVPGSRRFFRLTYTSYKLSVNRLVNEIVKSIDNQYFTVRKYDKIVVFEPNNDEHYQIKWEANDAEKKILTKAILTADFDIPDLNIKGDYSKKRLESIFYFTYPAGNLQFEKNIVFRKDEILLKIIPWFDWIYFEFSVSDSETPTIDQLLIVVKNYFPDIELDKDRIAVSGTYQRALDNKQNDVAEFIYHINNQEYNVYFRPLKKWLTDANKVCKQILNWYGKNGINTKLLQSTRLKGSDFDFPYHPLRLIEYCDEKYDEAKQILKSPQYFKKLFYRYGSQIEEITCQAFEYWNKTKNIQQAWLMAEIWYAIHHEFCTSAIEFINNRTEEWMSGKDEDIEFIENAFEDLLK